MEEQKYIIENQESFELEDIFECGQCFRWNKQKDGSYTGVIKNAVINVQKIENRVVFCGKCIDNNFESIIRDYFDLDTNYNKLKEQLAKIDINMELATKFGKRN